MTAFFLKRKALEILICHYDFTLANLTLHRKSLIQHSNFVSKHTDSSGRINLLLRTDEQKTSLDRLLQETETTLTMQYLYHN